MSTGLRTKRRPTTRCAKRIAGMASRLFRAAMRRSSHVITATISCGRIPFPGRVRNLLSLRCCLTQRNSSSTCQRALSIAAISCPPTVFAVALVEHVGGAGLERGLLAGRDIVDGGRRDLDPPRMIGRRITALHESGNGEGEHNR